MVSLKRALILGIAVLIPACTVSQPKEGPSPPSTSSSTPTASPTATVTPSPTPTLPAGFVCAGASGGASHASDWGPAGPKVVAVRAGQHAGYDRFVVQFDGTVPTYRITRQGPQFTLSPSGKTVTLQGTDGVLIRINPEDWTAYSGPKSLRPGFPFLREARLVENFEGTMQWGLGIQGIPCLRATTLLSPPRLVIDVVGLAAPLSFADACTARVLLPFIKQSFDHSAKELIIDRIDIHRCRGGYAYLHMIPRTNPTGHPQYDAAQVYLRYVDGWWKVVTIGTGIRCSDPGMPSQVRRACRALGYLT